MQKSGNFNSLKSEYYNDESKMTYISLEVWKR